jgi:hypothetical protein
MKVIGEALILMLNQNEGNRWSFNIDVESEW